MEKKMERKIPLALIILLVLLFSIHIGKSSTLILTLTTDNEKYTIGETITINGTLTLDGTPVSDAVVTIQINLPNGALWVIRTKQTGTTTKTWPLEILEAKLYSGTTVRRGWTAGFNVTIKNNGFVERQFKLMVNTFYSNSIPFAIQSMYEGTIGSNDIVNICISSVITIPNDAPLGKATAYFNLLTDLPVNGGFAYCPEKALTFNITGTGSGTQVPPVEEPEPSNGKYALKLKTPSIYAFLGNYTVYASTFYYPYATSATTQFKVFLRGDLTGPSGLPDGKCDIIDVAFVAVAYGTRPGDPNWNPQADLNSDGIINIIDVATVAYDYGKIGIIG
jgi:hypothetical protein